jgi:hypothetical protein
LLQNVVKILNLRPPPTQIQFRDFLVRAGGLEEIQRISYLPG